MKIGVPKEIKAHEYRVALTPATAAALAAAGHEVTVEAGAGAGSGFADAEYEAAGASLSAAAADVWEADLILKVKEPLQQEYLYFRSGQLLFTYLHLAAAPGLAAALTAAGVTGIAYETVQDARGALPLLTPMSEVAGRLSVQAGAQFLETFNGGRGILLGGVPGVPPGQVVIVGGGIVGTNAARVALGMGADVVIVEKSAERMRQLDEAFDGRIRTLMSNPFNLSEAAKRADLLIGAVLIPGAKAPHLITEEMVQAMKKGSVIVDVAVDQGGCIATVDRATTHADPVYVKHGVIHYAVANIPGAVPRTSTLALTNVTAPYVLELAEGGIEAVRRSAALRSGVNTYDGSMTHQGAAAAAGLSYRPLSELLPE